MATRKPSIDGLDDIDDEDGDVEEELSQDTDMTLNVQTADEVFLGGDPPLEGSPNTDEVEDDRTAEEEL
jgi:hypothetical protein